MADVPVIDFHSHVLPGIDDGSKDVDTSLHMMDMAGSQGVDIMIATPHFYASRHRIEEFLSKREHAWKKLQEGLKQNPGRRRPEILLGAETAFFRGISQADKIGALTIADTDIILLEMPFEPWKDSDIREVRSLVEERHFRLVLAHLERYMDIGSNKKRFPELLRIPAYVQINAESLSGKSFSGWRRRKLLYNMFREGQAHLLGSDCHGIHHRIPNLDSGREAIKTKLGSDFLKEMDHFGKELLHLGGETDD